MKKSMLFAAAAVVAMVGCTNEDFTGFQNKAENGEMAINFGSGTKKMTRGGQLTGADAANALGKNFVVLGVKGDAKMSSSSISVFDYYNVNWQENTAGTTESNSSNWEYVNQSVNGLSSLASQTIKYWDFAKKQYDFIAFSKGKNESKTIDQLFTTVKLENLGTANPAYTVMGTLDELKECYIADLKTVYNPSEATGDLEKEPTYTSGAVTPVFRRLQSKIRVAFYETVPGYSVKDVKFYKDAATSTTSGTTPYLYADGEKLAVGGTAEGLMEVSFPTIGRDSVKSSDYNKASIKFSTLSGTSALSKEIEFKKSGADIALSYTTKEKDEKTGTEFLGRSSNNATYIGENTEDNDYAYVKVLPTGNGTVLNLKVDYTLESIDGSGEEITVHGATAQVPAIYTEWQPNYAYTYIFKISDQTNGVTNPDQTGYVGLYPITFDAVVEGDIDGIQETITEVGEPSITTYQKGKVVTEKDEYKAGTDPIYVTVDNGAKLTKKFYAAGAVNIYTATLVDANGACQTISEKAVANCVLKNFNPASVAGPYSVTDKNGQTLTLTKADGWTLETKIDKSDAPHGVNISTNGSDSCVAKIASPAAGTYVFQYMKTAATYDAPEFNTLATNATYYKVTKSGNVETYTVETADGKETYEANKYIKSLPVVDDANKLADETMETGVVYFEKSTRGTSPAVTVYTKKTSDGTEIYTADLRYTATLKKAEGTLAKDSKYYVKEGNTENYIERVVTDAAGLVVKSSDPYYVIDGADFTEIASTTYVYLKAGQKCYAWDASGYKLTTIEKTTGKELTADTYYSTVTPAVYYDDSNKAAAFNTIASGTVCFTNTEATDSAPKAETAATGDETSASVEGKVVKTKPVYYYKVIKVQ